MDRETVRYLAQLGRLVFTDEELDKMSEDMTDIIELMDTIKNADAFSDTSKYGHSVNFGDLREDIAGESYPTARILQNAVSSENAFVVPRVVE